MIQKRNFKKISSVEKLEVHDAQCGNIEDFFFLFNYGLQLYKPTTEFTK